MSSTTAPQSNNGNQTDRAMCRICLNDNFESDSSKLNLSAIEPAGVELSESVLQERVSPCRCTGSVGMIHKGCLLLEVQYRKSSTCQLCKSKYRYVQVVKTNHNTLLGYMRNNKLRSIATVLYFVSIPLLTTLWFCNKLKFASVPQVSAWNDTYRTLVTKYQGMTTTGGTCDHQHREQPTQLAQAQMTKAQQSQAPPQPSSISGLHPLLLLVYWYHCDVIWINLVNLCLIQMIMNNLEHLQAWSNQNRPRVAIHLSPD